MKLLEPRTAPTNIAKRLGDVAEVRLGLQVRGSLRFDPQGEWQLIQIKDLDERRRLRADDLSRIHWEPASALRCEVVHGDVLFLSRGQRNFAIAMVSPTPKTLAASYFFIVRPQNDLLLPEYLAWYLNQPPAQEYLHSRARRGSHMPIVPKAAFEELPIALPPLPMQRTIVRLAALGEREHSLLEDLQSKRSALLHSMCLQGATKSS